MKGAIVNALETMALLPFLIGSFACLMLVSSIEKSEEVYPESEVIVVNDTIYELDGSFRYMLRHCYYLELAQRTVFIPIERTVTEEGIVGEILDMAGDPDLEMFVRIPVEVTAGIDASLIEIHSYEYDEERRCISSMNVSLPAPQITSSRVEHEFFEAHFREGHVRNSMQNIMDFLVEASREAERSASEICMTTGILEDAEIQGKNQITLLLWSVGVENVQFVDAYGSQASEIMASTEVK